MKEYEGHSLLDTKYTKCPECGAPATYIEYIVAEGYPDAHVEYTEYCSSCGYDYCSEDN